MTKILVSFSFQFLSGITPLRHGLYYDILDPCISKSYCKMCLFPYTQLLHKDSRVKPCLKFPLLAQNLC